MTEPDPAAPPIVTPAAPPAAPPATPPATTPIPTPAAPPIAALVAAARAAAIHAHAPYSRFAVGAALLMDDGEVVTGANVENASYGLSLCAETVAVATASAAGRLAGIVAVAVVGGAMDASGRATGTTPVSPCGRCRQVLNEAAQMGGRDLLVHCGAAEGGAVASYRLADLLPHAFGPADLGVAPLPTPPLR